MEQHAQHVTTREIDLFRDEFRESRSEILTAIAEVAKYQKEQNGKLATTINRVTILETAGQVGRDYTSRWLGVLAIFIAAAGFVLRLLGK